MSIAITTNQPHRSGPSDRRQDRPEAGRGFAAPVRSPKAYWDDRATRFASRGAGLGAVCSYGMPSFYNGTIHLVQYLALRRWLRVRPGTTVLEIGCGVGRWSLRFAQRGAIVTGMDLSQRMVLEARRRSRAERLTGRCNFVVSDISSPGVRGRFDVVFGVTVLQHLLDPAQFERAVMNISRFLAPGGRAIVLEAAPSRPTARCNTPVFVAREDREYLDAFRRAGLRCRVRTGVDPAPFKTWFLPRYRSLPRPLALAGLAGVTAAAFPIDVALGRFCADASWHKLFILEEDHS